jgi:TPR repeat protein
MAADQGNARGQFRYGYCLTYRSGVDIDLVLAASYYKELRTKEIQKRR